MARSSSSLSATGEEGEKKVIEVAEGSDSVVLDASAAEINAGALHLARDGHVGYR